MYGLRKLQTENQRNSLNCIKKKEKEKEKSSN